MKFSTAVLAGVLALQAFAHKGAHGHTRRTVDPPILRADPDSVAPLVDPPGNAVGPKKLAARIQREALLAGSQTLQSFANSGPRVNRVFGSEGHNKTVNYILSELQKTGYYNARLQPQVHLWSDSNQTLTVDGVEYDIGSGTYVPNGRAKGPLILVKNFGCNATDFPAKVKGKITLISRGTCTFSDKVALSGNAGAIGAIIYNNVEGPLGATLGSPSNPLGPYVPTVFATQADGEKFVKNRPPPPVAEIYVNAVFENRTTYNVIATTKGGDQNNIIALGAHTDSVNEGPGINDNGSGSIGILEVAKQLAQYEVKNAVRFLWWTAEEFGLLGSTFYVDELTKKQASKIRAYLNFDMIASPNYAYQIYDGDGSGFNISGPPGSAQIEKLFEDFFIRRGEASVPTAFDGRSDYGPFLDIGIASGGLFTGAEDPKTEAEAEAFGGTAGEPYDACYHQACDNINNLNLDAFTLNTKAIAVAVGTYARNLDSIPVRNDAARIAQEEAIDQRQATREQRKHEAAISMVRSCGHEQVKEAI